MPRIQPSGAFSDPYRPLVTAGYANKNVLRRLPPRTTLIERIRKDTKLFNLPDIPATEGKRGPKQIYAPLFTPEQIRQEDTIPWIECPAFARDAPALTLDERPQSLMCSPEWRSVRLRCWKRNRCLAFRRCRSSGRLYERCVVSPQPDPTVCPARELHVYLEGTYGTGTVLERGTVQYVSDGERFVFHLFRFLYFFHYAGGGLA